MKTNLKIFFILFISVIGFTLQAQDKTIGSLKLALKTAKNDTTSCGILLKLSELEINQDTTFKLLIQIQKIAESNLSRLNKNTIEYRSFNNYLSKALINIGEYYHSIGSFDKAYDAHIKNVKIQDTTTFSESVGEAYFYVATVLSKKGDLNASLLFFNKSLNNFTKIRSIQSEAVVLSEMAEVYHSMGNIKQAILYNFKSLNICEKNDLKINMPPIYRSLGLLYASQNDFEKAFDCLFKGLRNSKQIKSDNQTAQILHAIGYVYSNQSKDSLAFKYYKESLKFSARTNNKFIMPYTINNIGKLYSKIGKNDSALKYFTLSLKAQKALNEKPGIAMAMANIGKIYLKQNKTDDAIKIMKEALLIVQKDGYLESVKQISSLLYSTYKEKKDPKNALQYYELFIQMRDSLNNKETRNASIKSKLKYEYEKKATADSVRVVEEKKVIAVQLNQEKTQRYALYGGLALVGLFSIFMVNRFRITNKQKKLIESQKKIVEHQKHLVDEKQKEVLDSIRYAKRIQESLLPTETYISRNMRNLKQ